MGWGRDFYERQLKYMAEGDLDTLMEKHFHEDSMLVTHEFILTGREQIRKYYEVDSPEKSGAITGVRMHAFTETDDTLMFTAVVSCEKLGTFVARDAYMMRDGKIQTMFSLTLPPGDDTALYE